MVIFLGLEIFRSFFRFRGGTLVFFKVSMAFRSIDGFREYFGHFFDLGGILVILRFRGVFISLLGL